MSNAVASVNTRIRIELARTRRSQADLALVLGLSQAGVSRRMSGATSWDLAELERVAEFLGIELGQLVTADVATAATP